MNLGLGIDTGGTYTDSVVLDMDSGTVLKKAKALTTREDLSIGIANSIRALGDLTADHIRLVSMSTTLATNSVVEGKGCRVALILIGMEQRDMMPVVAEVEVQGGHNLAGHEQTPLEIEKVESFVRDVRDKVDAFAVSSLLSVRNPDHELQTKQVIHSICDLPVICGHELSNQLGFYERSITAVLNAKLIPIVADLMRSVRTVLTQNGIKAPLMVVKGDGSLMGERMALQRPVETVLSGPAASLIGAKFLTGEKESVIIDIGGTTTDIGVLRNGLPHLDAEGAMIGGWRTRVKAVDIMTSGIGGDSRIIVMGENITLSPQRVVPLCIASTQHPSVKAKLQEMAEKLPRLRTRLVIPENIPQHTEFFAFSKMVGGYEMTEIDKQIIMYLKEGPKTMFELGDLIGIDPYSYNPRYLEELGIVSRIGLTPTDILHASGEYVCYDSEASRLAVSIQSRMMGMEEVPFTSRVKAQVIGKVSKELMSKMLLENTGLEPKDGLSEAMVDHVSDGAECVDYVMHMDLKKPIIGIGAPVGAYLPAVSQRFRTALLIPEHSEVGNAIGSITGNVLEVVEVMIRPKSGVSNIDNPPCVMFSQHEKKDFATLDEAKAYATQLALREAEKMAKDAGADEVEVSVSSRDECGRLGTSNGVFLHTVIVATAIGKPKWAS